MKKMRLHKLLAMVCCLTIGICGMNFNSINVEATQSKSENFNSVTLTGNYADDIVAIAKAQEGRTQSQMGYTESWCADFVSDCAKIAGISNLIPFNGLVSSLYNAVISAGGTVVTTPQKGDLVFYYCTKCASPYKHAGIMVDATSSIDGNYGSKVTQHLVSYYNDGSHYVSKGEVQCIYVRPAYNASPTPPITGEYRTGQYKVTAEPSLRVRNQPSTSGTQLGSVMKGALVQVLEVKNGWGKIKFNGNDGWISLEFCEYIGSGDQGGSDP